MDDELEFTEQDLAITPRPAFLTFATEVSLEAGPKVRDADVEALARLFQLTMTRCQEATVKEALIESAKRPNSVIAQITRRRINKMLPPFLKESGIEPIIIRLGAIAAEIPELWDLLTPD